MSLIVSYSLEPQGLDYLSFIGVDSIVSISYEAYSMLPNNLGKVLIGKKSYTIITRERYKT